MIALACLVRRDGTGTGSLLRVTPSSSIHFLFCLHIWLSQILHPYPRFVSSFLHDNIHNHPQRTVVSNCVHDDEPFSHYVVCVSLLYPSPRRFVSLSGPCCFR